MKNPKDPESPPRIVYHKSWLGWSENVRVVNNIFYNDSPTAVYDFRESIGNIYSHNLFFGHHLIPRRSRRMVPGYLRTHNSSVILAKPVRASRQLGPPTRSRPPRPRERPASKSLHPDLGAN